MAEDDRANKNLCDIVFSVTFELMKSMDTDRGWESLAAAAGLTFDRMQLLSQKLLSDGSPTKTLLWELGCKNYTVNDLYEKLRSVRRLREMQILENYVKNVNDYKGTTVGKKMSSLFVSLPHQAKVADQKPQLQSEFGSSMPGSENNFNQYKAKVAGSKHYEDKIIPGREDRSLGTSFGTCNNELVWSSVETPRSTGRSTPTNNHQTPMPETLLRSKPMKDTSCISLPISPSFRTRPAERPNSNGIENIPQFVNTKVKVTPSPSLGLNVGPSSGTVSRLDYSTKSEDTESKACFSYRTLVNATDGFDDRKIIGQGAFGQVYLGTINQLDCAIKKLHSSMDTAMKSDQVKSELSALLNYRHENIVTFYGYAQTESELCLVYQYLESGSLEDRLLRKNNTPSLSWERRLNILVGATKGLNYLHTLGKIPLIHGDIKSANILLDQYFEAKLGDLGQAKYAASQSTESTGLTHITVAESTTKLFGTRAYLAPELRSNGSQSLKSDVYALGVVFLEVCSGQKAIDPTRIENIFLADYFNLDISEKDESLWKEYLQDRTLTEVPDDSFLEVLKLASKCINRIKKQRPEIMVLLCEVKEIYKRNKEHIRDERPADSSLSTSLEINSCNTINSCYLSSDVGSQHEEQTNCPSPLKYDSVQQNIVRLEQQQILDQYKSTKTTKSAKQNSSKDPSHQQEGSSVGSCSPVYMNETIVVRNFQASEGSLLSFPPNTPLPEAFQLQAAYDSQPERKKIDHLSGQIQKNDQLGEEYPFDPHKLQKSDELEMKQQKSMPCSPDAVQLGAQLPDQFPQADPKKLAQLNAFDDTNFGKWEPAEIDQSILECDPAKMAFLRNFDDGVYKKLQKTDGYSDTQQTTTTEEHHTFYNQQESELQAPTEQQAPDFHGGLPYNSITDVFDNKPIYNHIFATQRLSESDGYTAFHLGNRRPSGDSNIENELIGDVKTGSATVEPHVELKPRKEKIHSFLAKYKALKYNDDEDDDVCDNEENN